MKIEFSTDELPPKAGVVVSFDLENFSGFCNHPDAGRTIPKLESAMFDLLYGLLGESILDGLNREFGFEHDGVREPDHAKFTGDGALLIWVEERLEDFSTTFCRNLVLLMRSFQAAYAAKTNGWEISWRCSKLPARVRVGITAGTLYQLATKGSGVFFYGGEPETVDYAGYCINLAVRLQDHYKPVGFLVHHTLHPGIDDMIQLTARNVRGAQEERVWLFEKDSAEAEAANPRAFHAKFGPKSSYS